MNSKFYIVASLVGGLLVVAGCESVALMPRPDVDEAGVSRNRADRDSGLNTNRVERGRDRGEVSGIVQRVDDGPTAIFQSRICAAVMKSLCDSAPALVLSNTPTSSG